MTRGQPLSESLAEKEGQQLSSFQQFSYQTWRAEKMSVDYVQM